MINPSSSTILVILVGKIPRKPSRILVSGELIPSYYYLFCLFRPLHIPFMEIPKEFQFLIQKQLSFFRFVGNFYLFDTSFNPTKLSFYIRIKVKVILDAQ